MHGIHGFANICLPIYHNTIMTAPPPLVCSEDVFACILNFLPRHTQRLLASSHSRFVTVARRRLVFARCDLSLLVQSSSPRDLVHLVEANASLQKPENVAHVAWLLLRRVQLPTVGYLEQTRLTALLFTLVKHYRKIFHTRAALLHGLFVYTYRFPFLALYRRLLFTLASPDLRRRWYTFCLVCYYAITK